uniref:Uncharacterized protein n=1 Tax=Alexandrium catenella TaxID=2925 RepID=A0A7S1KYL1_ALECA|mmetsp:Transcript_103202/g.274410  ORF Transcript_103202/g.274410 Transcript_103202/m.274410 type:complete len:430 (+) Transcript_103202:118-1407(+)
MSRHGSSDLDPEMFGSAKGDLEGWQHPPASLTGDFYREPDNVYRGLSMSEASLEAPRLSPFKGFTESDFYCEPDDILKGMSMAAEAPASRLGGSLDIYKGFSKSSQCPSKTSTVSPGNERFTEADAPPDAPADPFFKLEVTTVHISSRTPSEIGNNLLDFLNTRVVSSIAKVNRRKFTVKADVFVEASACALKARAYREDQGTYAVEFQRRSGDAVAFNRVFQQAANFLSPRFVPVKSTFEATPDFDCEELLRLSMTESKGELAPLLDMAGLLDLPSLQAECAAALAEMAQDTHLASRLCTRRTFEDFKKLLQADQTDVAYPTARMLLYLAQCPEAVPCFADRGVLSMMLDKVRSKATSALVQQQLAQALNAAITRCAANFSQKVSDDIMSDLIKAIKDISGRDTPTYRNLKEAQLVLQFQCRGASGWP